MIQPRRFITLLVIASLSHLLLPPQLQAHREYVHQYLAIEAYRLLLQRYPGLSSTEMASHIGTQSGNCDGFQFTAGTVTAGAYREDCEDPVYHYGDVIGGLDKAYFSASHFWDADAGDGSTIRICDVACGNYNNAYQKSLRYVLPGIYGRWTAKLTWPAGSSSFYLEGGGTTTIFHAGLIGFEYDSLAGFFRDGRCTLTGYMDITGKWQSAATVPDKLPRRIIAPKAVRDRIGWEVIGRIAHLLGDMGVPAHTHNDIHPPFWWNNEPADIFEEEMSRLYTAWTHAEALEQGGLLDFRSALRPGSAERVMRYFVYTTNQFADRFPSNDADGDLDYDVAWDGDDYSVLDMIREIGVDPRERDVFHREAAEYAFVYSIRSIAGLLEWFARETGILAGVSVDASFAGASVLVDGKPRSTPVAVTLPAGTRFTLSAADQQGTDSATGTPVTMKFNSWTRSAPGQPEVRLTTSLLSETALDGCRYLARFDRVVTVTIAAARHFDGGTGGRYTVNGADAGESWSASVNTGTTQAITVGFVPPPGSVFLGWSDGNRANPREVRLSGNVDIRAFSKRRLISTVPPADRPANQRRMARPGMPTTGGYSTVMTYVSAGDIFVAWSVDGVAWGPEELLSDGRGASRDPSVDGFTEPDGQVTVVAWEETLPGGIGRRVVARTRYTGSTGWSPLNVLESDPAAGTVRATPVVSAGLVVWRGASGILVRNIAGGPVFAVPGSGPSSSSPVVDYYAPAEGKFALCWVESGTTLWFVRGTPGGAWGAPRQVAAAAAPDEIRSADLALTSSGAGCIAWSAASPTAGKINYRQFDQLDQWQLSASLTVCTAGAGTPPSVRLTHHRFDAAAPKDLGLHAWNPLTGIVTTLLLRSAQKVGPGALGLDGGFPELARAAISPAGATPAFLTVPAAGGNWSLTPTLLPLVAILPATPLLSAPAPGASGLGASVTLSWSCAADASSFDVQLCRNESFQGALDLNKTGITGTSIALQALSPGSSYFWRVRSVNSFGGGNFSPSRSFSTAIAPSAPDLSGAVVTTSKGSFPRLTWSPVPGADSYRLYRYLCSDPSDCSPAAARPAAVYDGPLTTFTDGSILVSRKEPAGLACYYAVARNAGFAGPASVVVSFTTPSDIVWAEKPPVPVSSGLDDNYPNPFNPSTTVAYRLADPARVTITASNILAQRVATVFEGTKDAGFHELSWDASGLPAGVYFLLMEVSPTNGAHRSFDKKKVVLIK